MTLTTQSDSLKTKKALSLIYQQCFQKWNANDSAIPFERFYDYLADELVKAGVGFTEGVEPTIHLLPRGGVTGCCGKTPFELPSEDRLTNHIKLVTCQGS